ncbi:hypothetical protein [Streptomyces sp. NPDC006368]|uniref:hypothetical protein n=1 Tax=Streptomyces sp. NPDC006368 TaxID=3156760 RepID=UPI0033A2C95A
MTFEDPFGDEHHPLEQTQVIQEEFPDTAMHPALEPGPLVRTLRAAAESPIMNERLPGPSRIQLDHRAGVLHVSGPGLPRVRLVRTSTGAPDEHIPIGTRDRARLTLTVDGEPTPITPAKGRLSRRSYRVDAKVGNTRYRLVPCAYGESRLLKDGKPLGELGSTGDGEVRADWDGNATVLAQDVAVGTTLAAAFATGAAPWWETAGNVIGELIP